MTNYQHISIKALGTVCDAWYLAEKPELEIEGLFIEIINDFEMRFSRFRNDSLVGMLNNRALGKGLAVDSEFLKILDVSMKWMKHSNGIFNPFALPQIHRIGYINPFGSIQPEVSPIADFAYPRSFEEVSEYLQIVDNTLTKKQEVFLDFGGIGKGYLVDKLVGIFDKYCVEFCIDLGGDLFVRGDEEWDINVADIHGGILDTHKLKNCGMATSSNQKRNFRYGGHIVDPRGRILNRTEYKYVTVVSADAVDADVLGKVLMIDPEYKSEKILNEFYY